MNGGEDEDGPYVFASLKHLVENIIEATKKIRGRPLQESRNTAVPRAVLNAGKKKMNEKV